MPPRQQLQHQEACDYAREFMRARGDAVTAGDLATLVQEMGARFLEKQGHYINRRQDGGIDFAVAPDRSAEELGRNTYYHIAQCLGIEVPWIAGADNSRPRMPTRHSLTTNRETLHQKCQALLDRAKQHECSLLDSMEAFQWSGETAQVVR